MEPPPWSPERTAWTAAVAPWLMAWLRFMRAAQAGAAEDVVAAPVSVPTDPPLVAARGDWPPEAVHAPACPA